jgi:hypothetical protein
LEGYSKPASPKEGVTSTVAILSIANGTIADHWNSDLASRRVAEAFRQATALWVKQRFPMM